jgi:hypothetical protein
MKNKIIDDFYDNEGKLSKPLSKSLDWKLLGSNRSSEEKVHEILNDIINNHKNGKVGVVNGLEGGLTIDYLHNTSKQEWRFIMGFTELGYWTYCNAPKDELKHKL